MRILDLFNSLNKIIKILELYKNMHLDEALDKIYADLKEYKKNNQNETEKIESNINYEEIINELKRKNKQESTEYLEKYTKGNLVKLSKFLDIRVSNSSPKVQLINEIINHFGYSQLNDMMAERNKS